MNLAEQIAPDGTVEYIAMSLPFIREPALIKRWKLGDRKKQNVTPIICVFSPAFKVRVYCVTEEREAQKRND